jgi:hypothetical protein
MLKFVKPTPASSEDVFYYFYILRNSALQVRVSKKTGTPITARLLTWIKNLFKFDQLESWFELAKRTLAKICDTYHPDIGWPLLLQIVLSLHPSVKFCLGNDQR